MILVLNLRLRYIKNILFFSRALRNLISIIILPVIIDQIYYINYILIILIHRRFR